MEFQQELRDSIKVASFAVHYIEAQNRYIVTPPRRPLWVGDKDGVVAICNRTSQTVSAVFPVGTVSEFAEHLETVPADTDETLLILPTSPKEFAFQVIVGGQFAEAASDPRVRTYP